jgi:Flp pilus assembly protein TadG
MLLVLFFGLIEFGNAWRIFQLVTNTAREGAREAVLPSSTTATVDSVIDEHLNGSGLDVSQATVSLGICSGRFTCTDLPDTVTIDYPYQFVFLGPVIQLMCGGVGCDGSAYSTVNLSSTAIMRNE